MIPRDCYNYENFETLEVEEFESDDRQKAFDIEDTDTSGEILWKLKGHDVPFRPVVYSEMLSAMNIFKSVIVLATKTISPVRLYFSRRAIIHELARVGDKTVRFHILRRKHRSVFEKELFLLIHNILFEFGIEKELCYRFAEYLAFTIEHDSYYRDMLQEFLTGEPLPDRPKYRKIKLIQRFAFLFSRKLRRAIETVNLENLKPDEIDKYWRKIKCQN